MAVEVALNTPLADALGNAVQSKLMETGWAAGGLDDSALGEYIILMLVNGKTQDQIAEELSTDLLSLPLEDTGPAEFSRWLFEQVGVLDDELNGRLPEQLPQMQSTHHAEDQGTSIRGAASRQSGDASGGDFEMREAIDDVQDGNMCVFSHRVALPARVLTLFFSPTGPKSMRNGSRAGVGNKRMVGQLNKAMDRSGEASLHRVRAQQGSERINMHNRQPPKGPRNDQSWNSRLLANGRPTGGPNGAKNGPPGAATMQMTPQQQMQLMAMLEQQAQMMAQIMPQQMPGMSLPGVNPAFQNGGQAPGKSLLRESKVIRDGKGGFAAKNQADIDQPTSNGNTSSSMEVEVSQIGESSPDTICKFNLKCTKKDCSYAHQSPAAPPNITVDVHDICPFGAACKNKKCVGRHPSPFQKVAHASEQDCKFFPNCTNASCPFRHPTMPMCRNGADCNREGCKFTHVRIMCKYNPCLNPDCVYKHAEGQKRGKYGDKVWTADQEKEHVSERKFIDDEMGEEELVRPDERADDSAHGGSQHSAEVVA
ncbi:uncharacterized protein KY384_002521 [Bacidia gigantensis]|uniref:uncharacterized protein n=1 Tax=Bacidia gigantensis TaxID=2732470 RepID=UPI001D0466F1|nr:uncharacterized protein KY384_002521 [Bacidia gigantensis]KAG8532644.1 hypothetical protein KY384_002521 [Bacidia gigantensis]